MGSSAILLINCPDRKGIVAAVTEFIYSNKGNILDLDQHVDVVEKAFFMRVEWDLEGFAVPAEKIREVFSSAVAAPLNLSFEIHFSDQVQRMAVFVSKLSHCLYDMLSSYESGDWKVKIPLIISNHEDLRPVAERFGIAFHLLPVSRETKAAQEEKALALLNEHRIDFIVLARYMQILSADFVVQYPSRIINIHHSFLPAFVGAKPYHAAHARGVKIIGAPCHYVTTDLDAGPIIKQDIVRISHRDSIDDLIRKGRDLEKIVLSRGIWSHLQRTVLVYKNKTVVFD